jgi:hypothetical protein
MRRILILAVTVIAMLTVTAPAMASVRGAERAVKSEVRFDNGSGSAEASCKQRGYGYYTCTVWWHELTSWCIFNGSCENARGAARVTQRGSRYSVSYRLYW